MEINAKATSSLQRCPHLSQPDRTELDELVSPPADDVVAIESDRLESSALLLDGVS
jgi:hypothetical protein